MKFCDSHCHLDFSEFDSCRAQVLERCKALSVARLVVPSVKRKWWGRVLDLASKHEVIDAALGLHPYFVDEHLLSDLADLECIIKNRRDSIVAIGEIGVDSYIGRMDRQKLLFTSQLSLAEKYHLPVILHARKMHSYVAGELKKIEVPVGIVHAYSGSFEQLSQYLKIGFYIGVGGVITFEGSTKTRAAIARAPLESLVLETDSPDMRVNVDTNDKRFFVDSVQSVSMSRPEYVVKVFESLCEIRPESPEVIATQLWENARSALQLSKIE